MATAQQVHGLERFGVGLDYQLTNPLWLSFDLYNVNLLTLDAVGKYYVTLTGASPSADATSSVSRGLCSDLGPASNRATSQNTAVLEFLPGHGENEAVAGG